MPVCSEGRGAACRQLAPVQLLCVHRAAAALGKAEGAQDGLKSQQGWGCSWSLSQG